MTNSDKRMDTSLMNSMTRTRMHFANALNFLSIVPDHPNLLVLLLQRAEPPVE